jgi:hypothetical protein
MRRIYRHDLPLLQRREVDLRTTEILLPIDEPLNGCDDNHNSERDDAVIHTGAIDWKGGWEDEEDRRDNDIGYAKLVYP